MSEASHYWSSFNANSAGEQPTPKKGEFIFAEQHLHFDCWRATNLSDKAVIENALRNAVAELNEELLHIHLQSCEPNNGVSSIAITPSAQISIRTWPTVEYASIDLFLSNSVNYEGALSVFKRALRSEDMRRSEQFHGRQMTDMTPTVSDFTGSDLNGSDFAGSDFAGSELTGSDYTK